MLEEVQKKSTSQDGTLLRPIVLSLLEMLTVM
jgi:hypothetical protein